MAQENPIIIDAQVVKEIASGVYQQEVVVKNGKEGVMAEMPNFGYMLWSKTGEQLTDEEVQKKIEGGALVITGLTGLDSDGRELNDIVKQFYEQYKGDREVLICGLAKPGSWRMQYEKGKKMMLADVSAYKYVLMVLEWAKHMGLDGHNMAILGHSAGAEAAVWLSKWFKILGLNPALHPVDDPVFAAISTANIAANAVSENVPALNGGVEVVQQLTAVGLTGAGFGTPINLMHGERMKDGEGRTHDLAVTELCFEDKIPFWSGKPNVANMWIVRGKKDILTGPNKMIAWFKKWFHNAGMQWEWDDSWEKMSGWFPDKITRRLKHDTTLTDADAVREIGGKLVEMVGSLDSNTVVDLSQVDLKMLNVNIEALSGEDMTEEKMLKMLRKFDGNRAHYTLKTHREIGMEEYLKTDVYEQIKAYLEKVNMIGKDKFEEWNNTEEGRQYWRELVVMMLSNAKEDVKFTPDELGDIRSGKLSLVDSRVRARVARFPLECEWRGWLTDDDLNNVEFRGRASRGDTLDPVLYMLTDTILRRLPGMEVGDMAGWERIAYESLDDKEDLDRKLGVIGGSSFERMKKWYKEWVLAERDYANSLPGVN